MVPPPHELLEHTGSTNQRVDRVETQVSNLAGTVSNQGTTLNALSDSMIRMESSIAGLASSVKSVVMTIRDRDREALENQRAAKPNVLIVVGFLIPILSAIIGGAWLIGGTTARLDERDRQRDREISRIYRSIDQIDQRQWEQKR